MNTRASFRRLSCCTSGVAAIEFAMVGLLAISLILGTFEFGRALFLKNQLAFAADIATRHVLLNPPKTLSDLEHLETKIRDSMTLNHRNVIVDLALPSNDRIMAITLRQPLTLLVPSLLQKDITLSIIRRIPVP